MGVDSQNPGSLGAEIWCLLAAYNTVYVFDGFLAMCKISVGPEIGYKRKTGFEYGGSARVGAFMDLLNFEMGYLVNSKRTYMNIILNLPSGLGIWV